MSDMYGLNPREALTQIFYGHGPQTGAVEYQTWTKPRGISMVMLVAIGGGGSGGGGFTRASGAAGGGGGGGGAGAMTRVLVPASFLPDVLYPAPAPALAGGTASNNGLNGTRTIIAIQQDTSSGLAPNLLIRANGGSFGSGVRPAQAALLVRKAPQPLLAQCLLWRAGFSFLTSAGPTAVRERPTAQRPVRRSRRYRLVFCQVVAVAVASPLQQTW